MKWERVVGFDGECEWQELPLGTLGSIALDHTNGRFKAYWACGIEGEIKIADSDSEAAAKLVVCDWLRTLEAQIGNARAAGFEPRVDEE
jgi:hypothetical protein